ncbi:hypothetical protein ROHU_023269 [Labeo rohita]|uniref:Uncharacterized protein n=1 Tax=Labeo rohita TaxID=84645 RepID=A0A498MPQ4_LABRO|nr:hypothetical protein ROHU_034038 [Labeo rohita]RXN22761.1 hypothetical protein ROHU_023269 [Labeo rohita]
MLGNRCVVGTTVAQMPLTNWGLSGIAAKRKQHLRSLSSRQGVVGGVLPETGVVSSGFTGYGARVGNLMNCKSDLHDESGDTEELPGPLRRDLGLGISFPMPLLAQTSQDNLPSK